jgi:hypothetical protein
VWTASLIDSSDKEMRFDAYLATAVEALSELEKFHLSRKYITFNQNQVNADISDISKAFLRSLRMDGSVGIIT